MTSWDPWTPWTPWILKASGGQKIFGELEGTGMASGSTGMGWLLLLAVQPKKGNTHTLSRKMAELCKHMCMHAGVCMHLHMVLCMHVCMCENPTIIHVLCMHEYESDTCMYDT